MSRICFHSCSPVSLCLAAAVAACFTGACLGDDDPRTYADPLGDAVVRRTDFGADGPLNAQAGLPDLLGMAYGGWTTSSPTTNPYNGRWIDPRDTNLFRIDLVFDGVVNPPGPLNLQGEGYDPFRYGLNPVYGYIEFDLDSRLDTGGEIDNVRNRPLGNVSRFGGRFGDSVGERAAITAGDFDGNLLTAPLVERSGEEMHLAFCACFGVTITPINDPTPNTFDAGDTWIVAGRFLARTHAFSQYSGAFGGSRSGEYDPVIKLRFQHDVPSDRTTITLIHGLDNSGTAALLGQATQPIDFNAGNQTSILELLTEIRFTAQHTNDPGQGTPFDLLRDWADNNHAELDEYLRVQQWEVLALVGTTYAQAQNDAILVWTDVGPDFGKGDCDGDGFVNGQDQQVLMTAIANSDGTSFDADGQPNGQTTLRDFGLNFALYDLDYDGIMGSLDLAQIGYEKPGDVNSNGRVNQFDLALIKAMRGLRAGHPLFNPAADMNHDERIDSLDEQLFIDMIVGSVRR